MRIKRKSDKSVDDDLDWKPSKKLRPGEGSVKKQIIRSKHTQEVKDRCMTLLRQYKQDPDNNHTSMTIIRLILQLNKCDSNPPPGNTYIKLLEDSYAGMEACVYGHKAAKLEVLQYHTSRLLGSGSHRVLGLVGPPGIGKTSLAVNGISKALNLPLYQISLGGLRDVTYFTGSLPCWKGAHQGVFTDILIKHGPKAIVYIDEVDKVAGETAGDIYGWLTHALDPLANNKIKDNFLGMELDLSGLTFIFSYNNPEVLPAPLRDRIKEINLDGFTEEERIEISKRFIIPECLGNYRLTDKDIIFPERIQQEIITRCSGSDGIRPLKKFYQSLIDRLMLRMTCTYEGYLNYMNHIREVPQKNKGTSSFTGVVHPITSRFPYTVKLDDLRI